MSLGKQFATNPPVLHQSVAFKILVLNAGLVVAQLANQEIAAGDGRPSQENVRLHLHGALPQSRALPLVHENAALGTVGRIRRGVFFFDLDEKRIVAGATEHKDNVIAYADAAGSDYPKSDVLNMVLREPVLSLGQERLDIVAQPCNDLRCRPARQVKLQGFLLAEAILTVVSHGQPIEIVLGR